MAIEGLSILIPTWDRPEEVRQRLNEIALQFGPDQRVHVQVNPGRFGLADIGLLNPKGFPVSGAENEANVGLIANIAYGITHLAGEWIWILGDDDRLSQDCASLIAKGIAATSDRTIAVLHDQWPERERDVLSCVNCKDILCSAAFGSLLFISATVWRRRYFVDHLALFIDQSFSCSSQVALMLEGLKEIGNNILLFGKPLIDYQTVHRWSRVAFIQRMDTLLKLDLSPPDREKLARILYPQWLWAVRSGWQEVESGSVSFRTWLLASVQTFLNIHVHSPSAWIWPIVATMRKWLSRRRMIWRTRSAVVKGLVKQKIKG
jgi:hypothetical protein